MRIIVIMIVNGSKLMMITTTIINESKLMIMTTTVIIKMIMWESPVKYPLLLLLELGGMRMCYTARDI